MKISNTQQKVTDAYRDNPFWDKKQVEPVQLPEPTTKERCGVCGGPLENGLCTNLIREQQERT